MTTSTEGLTLQTLRRYHFGELSPEEQTRVEAALATNPEAAARLEKMRAEEQQFLDRTDVAAESVAILAKLDEPETQPSLVSRLFGARTLQLAMAFVVLVALVPIAQTMLAPQPAGNRTKGSVQLEMFVKDQGGVRKGDDGMRLSEGDQVQFRYQAVGHRYVFVVSVDSRGVVSPLYPDGPTESIQVRPDGRHTLDGSIILDDVTGPERIYAVFSDEPLPFEAIESALPSERDPARLQKLDIPRQDVDQATILIIKE